MREGPRPSAVTNIVVTTSVLTLCSSSPTRTAILISVEGADIYVSDNPAMGDKQGVRVVNGQMPLDVCTCHQGQWICKALYARTSAGTATVYIIEGFEDAWPNLAKRPS